MYAVITNGKVCHPVLDVEDGLMLACAALGFGHKTEFCRVPAWKILVDWAKGVEANTPCGCRVAHHQQCEHGSLNWVCLANSEQLTYPAR